MKSIVIFASHHGNTMKVAEAIVAELSTRGSAQLLPVEYAPYELPKQLDLVVVGGPTEAHHMTAPLSHYLGRIHSSAVRDVAAAAFDTRLKGPTWLWGSAATGIAELLGSLGARLVVKPESFYVTGPFGNEGGVANMVPGELDRARAWAARLAATVEAAQPVGARA